MGVHDECDRPYGGVQWGNPDDVKFFIDGVHGSGKRECLQVRSDSDAHIHGVHYLSDGAFWGEVGYWRQSEIDCTTHSPTPVPTPSPTYLDLSGTYTVKQVENGRYMDAHLNSGNDYSVVTRSSQSDDTQKWIFTRVGAASESTYT